MVPECGFGDGQHGLFSIKANWLRRSVLHSNMSNIIPLPFESTLSSSYADASELAQPMQRLKRHLAHVVNIRVTSEFPCCYFYGILTFFCRFVRIMASSIGGRAVSDEGVNGSAGLGEPGH